MEPCWTPKIANFGVKNGAHVATQHESMLVVNMEPTWSHVGPQKMALGRPKSRRDPPQDGSQVKPQKTNFGSSKLGSILEGVLEAPGRLRIDF